MCGKKKQKVGTLNFIIYLKCQLKQTSAHCKWLGWARKPAVFRLFGTVLRKRERVPFLLSEVYLYQPLNFSQYLSNTEIIFFQSLTEQTSRLACSNSRGSSKACIWLSMRGKGKDKKAKLKDPRTGEATSIHDSMIPTSLEFYSQGNLRSNGSTHIRRRAFQESKMLQTSGDCEGPGPVSLLLISILKVFFQGPPSARALPLFHSCLLCSPRRLDANHISYVPPSCFSGLHSLRHLWLDDNALTEIPVQAFRSLPALQAMTLALNKIHYIPDYAFGNLSSLVVL